MGSWNVVTAPTAGSVVSTTTFGIPVADNMSDSGWLTVANGSMINSWVNSSPAFGYRLIGNQVRLRGTITGGSNETSALTLPAGYQPSSNQLSTITANGPDAVCATVIATNGVVSVFWNQVGGSAPTTFSFDGVTFLVD